MMNVYRVDTEETDESFEVSVTTRHVLAESFDKAYEFIQQEIYGIDSYEVIHIVRVVEGVQKS